MFTQNGNSNYICIEKIEASVLITPCEVQQNRTLRKPGAEFVLQAIFYCVHFVLLLFISTNVCALNQTLRRELRSFCLPQTSFHLACRRWIAAGREIMGAECSNLTRCDEAGHSEDYYKQVRNWSALFRLIAACRPFLSSGPLRFAGYGA